MKKILILVLFIMIQNISYSSEIKKAYFAGGCFWCMEESFDKIKGVVKSVSGYTGGHLKNPTYKDVIYKDTGHVEAIEVSYNSTVVSYEDLLKVFWKNIDPSIDLDNFVIKVKVIDLLFSMKIRIKKKKL